MINKSGKKGLLNISKQAFIQVCRIEDADNGIFGDYQRYDFFQILWLTEVSGNTSYFLDFNEYILRDNQIVLIFPGQIDRMDIQGKKGYLMTIENTLFFQINQWIKSDYLNGYHSNIFLSVDTDSKQKLTAILQMVLSEIAVENRIILLKSYTEAFLFHIASLFEKSDISKAKPDSQVSELMWLIDHYFTKHTEVNFYASKLGVTNKKVNLILKKGTGKTIKQHIQERQILEIKKEIRLNSKTLKEIAFELGFSEPAYFSRFFKKHTGFTPSEFNEMGEFVQEKGELV